MFVGILKTDLLLSSASAKSCYELFLGILKVYWFQINYIPKSVQIEDWFLTTITSRDYNSVRPYKNVFAWLNGQNSNWRSCFWYDNFFIFFFCRDRSFCSKRDSWLLLRLGPAMPREIFSGLALFRTGDSTFCWFHCTTKELFIHLAILSNGFNFVMLIRPLATL